MARRKRKIKKPAIRIPKVTGTSGGGISGGNSGTRSIKSGVPKTAKSYKNLVRELRNTRARIRAAQNRLGKDYFGPSANDYTVENVMQRLEGGTHINRIYAELRGLNAEGLRRISEENTVVATSPTGWAITRKEAKGAQKAIDLANKVLGEARTKYGAASVPADYTIQDIADHVTTPEGLRDYADYLTRAYHKKTAGDMIQYPQSNEQILQGEYDYIQQIIERENQRRESNKKFQNDILKTKGRFITQSEFSLRPLEPDFMPTVQSYKEMAGRWDDVHRVNRANIWVTNYITSLNSTITNLREYNLLNGGIPMNVVNSMYNEILEYVRRLDRAEMVEKATMYSPAFSIAEVNYFNPEEALAALVMVLSEWENFFEEYG